MPCTLVLSGFLFLVVFIRETSFSLVIVVLHLRNIYIVGMFPPSF